MYSDLNLKWAWLKLDIFFVVFLIEYKSYLYASGNTRKHLSLYLLLSIFYIIPPFISLYPLTICSFSTTATYFLHALILNIYLSLLTFSSAYYPSNQPPLTPLHFSCHPPIHPSIHLYLPALYSFIHPSLTHPASLTIYP